MAGSSTNSLDGRRVWTLTFSGCSRSIYISREKLLTESSKISVGNSHEAERKIVCLDGESVPLSSGWSGGDGPWLLHPPQPVAGDGSHSLLDSFPLREYSLEIFRALSQAERIDIISELWIYYWLMIIKPQSPEQQLFPPFQLKIMKHNWYDT